MKYLILLLLLALPFTAHAGWRYLERTTLHTNPLAHPRSPTMALSIDTSKYEKQRVGYINAALGGQVGILSYYKADFAFQLGTEAGGWITLGWEGDTAFALLTEDFLLAFPLSFKAGDFSAAVKWNHISAHLGDGMSDLLEESLKGKKQKNFEFYKSLASHEGMDLSLREPLSYSRDFISVLISYQYALSNSEIRSYIHAGYIYKVVPDNLDRWFTGAGSEIKFWRGRGSPYTALDITWNQDTSSVDFSGQVGWLFRPSWTSYTLYVALTGFTGKDRRGQMHGEKLDQLGFGLVLR